MTMVALREQPRCARCGCRRIHHTRLMRNTSTHGATEETMVRCAVFDCGCPEYRANMGRARPQTRARH